MAEILKAKGRVVQDKIIVQPKNDSKNISSQR
jgi:hypothetical protein